MNNLKSCLLEKLTVLFATIGFIGSIGALIILYQVEHRLEDFQLEHQRWTAEQEEISQLQHRILMNQALLKKLKGAE